MKTISTILLLGLLLSFGLKGQTIHWMTLPNIEQMSSQRMLCMIQDSEGVLWYGTEGGGLCRDDGLHLSVMRNDVNNPDLLGSNNVGSLAEVGKYIVIGTFHGAYVVDKSDFSIRHLADVDDKRVDDIIVTHDDRVFLTANRKIYEFSADLSLKTIYSSRWNGKEVYVSHFHEDRKGRIWITQWSGGLLYLKNNQLTEASWPLSVTPTDVVDAPEEDVLFVGTVGQGIFRYYIDSGRIEQQQASLDAVCIDLQLSADGQRLWMTGMNDISLFEVAKELRPLPTDGYIPSGRKVLNRLSLDLNGRLLVAGSEPGPFVVALEEQNRWFKDDVEDDSLRWRIRERQGLMLQDSKGERLVNVGHQLLPILAKRKGHVGIWATDGKRLFACQPDSCWQYSEFSVRPVAMVDDGNGTLWFSTGEDVRNIVLETGREDSVIALPDVSALAFTPDRTLWIATIYGKVYAYCKGKLSEDSYACNERGDGVLNMDVDKKGRLLFVYDRYVRLYDPVRHTLSQQSREVDGVYSIELQETLPLQKWSGFANSIPQDLGAVTSPLWARWWIWLLLSVGVILLLFLRSRKSRMADTKLFGIDHKENTMSGVRVRKSEQNAEDVDTGGSFLTQAVSLVESHLSDDTYSVEQLSADLCMSRMTFYRKLQATTGQKPTEFMRTIRLQHAALMLCNGNMTVSEICYATGFTSVSYFSRSFRTMYGVPPTQFQTDLGNRTTVEDLSSNKPFN